MRIVWHFQAAGEARTFTVSYRFRGLAVAYDDVVDVNLRVWGDDWASPLGELAAVDHAASAGGARPERTASGATRRPSTASSRARARPRSSAR